MRKSTYTAPDNEIDRLIYYNLSHGRKRQNEIVKNLSTTRFAESSIKGHLRELGEKYEWAHEIQENGAKYYYREDVGQEYKSPSTPADYSEVEKLLRNAEIQLGIKPRNLERTPTERSDQLPECLRGLVKISQSHGKMFIDDELFNRYLTIFDKITEETSKAYPLSPWYVPSYTNETYVLHFMLANDRCDKWKEGKAREEFDQQIRKRSEELISLVDSVPTTIGNLIFSIMATIDAECSRIVFKKMLHSNNYDLEDLVTYAHYSYIIYGDTKSLLNDLSMWQVRCSSNETKQMISELDNRIRRQFSEDIR